MLMCKSKFVNTDWQIRSLTMLPLGKEKHWVYERNSSCIKLSDNEKPEPDEGHENASKIYCPVLNHVKCSL